ncbi:MULTISPECIES: substrate-binding domain-containing protein [Myroides]|uniref:ABC transporter substrate-binding protein n=1 Tax=Myroides albus TaxID=2562892 RepID=A0A6I3LIX5_9FLAO|nr:MULTISPECIES: substrate-binding domain-containing protein [Myroides]MTG97767.1 ABC transporter substrate-binding protein [Myroides albus]MVX35549.1 ABC transporter substrate-binding protein [Myroides sp. LoEW2-1]UVD79708.1 substrate-binding domain-containing protein [Myroides albus]UVD79723.1 substrate-binding domain-containing protein [Myroides albus]
MKKVKIIGVPEHFNLPWHLCIENGEFNEIGIDLQWEDIPEGTGKMCQLLRNEEADLAVILSEGIIKDISNGNQTTIVQEYVSSPLIWGIHVANSSPIQSIGELENKKIAISRYGSGSHLMAIVHAKSMNWDISSLQFVVVNTLEGAINALTDGEADYFMWERFMTQPIVDKQIFRRIGECPTPWPSFVIVGTNKFVSENKSLVKHILEVVNTTTAEFKKIPSIDRTLASKYNQKLEDIQNWLTLTRWSQRQLSQKHFDKIQNQLQELGQIETLKEYKHIIL